jgi:hypothetical protein
MGIADGLGSLAARFARRAREDPDFELAAEAPGLVAFRAAPDGLDGAALERLNAGLAARVNATGEVRLVPAVVGGRPALRLELGSQDGAADADRAWDVVADAFVGILVDSGDPQLRWDLRRKRDPAARMVGRSDGPTA